MAFSFQLLKAKSETNGLKAIAEREKRTLEAKKKTLAVRTENKTEDSAEIAAEITETETLIAATKTVVNSLPEGEKKEEEETNLMELELKLRRLKKSSTYSKPLVVVEYEYNGFLLDSQIAAIDQFLAQLDAYAATL